MRTPRQVRGAVSPPIDRRRLLGLSLGAAAALVAGCGGGSPGESDAAPPPAPAPTPGPTSGDTLPRPTAKSRKRGIAYDLASQADMEALAAGVSWFYNWSPRPNPALPMGAAKRFGVDFVPMLWNGDFDTAGIEALLAADPGIEYLLLLNEPNLVDQANLTPQQAAELWPRYEALAQKTGVKLVGPALTWGTMKDYADPVAWLDDFHIAYQLRNAGRLPRIDHLAFHWYDYGLAAQLDRLSKYGKSFWVTEFANWHLGDGDAQIDSVAKQKAQMAEMVAVCESRADVMRYAWFTGRWRDDFHHTSLLGPEGQLTELGQWYVSLPF